MRRILRRFYPDAAALRALSHVRHVLTVAGGGQYGTGRDGAGRGDPGSEAMLRGRHTVPIAVIGAIVGAGCGGGGGSPAAQAPSSGATSTSSTSAASSTSTSAAAAPAAGAGQAIHGSWLQTVPGIAADPNLYSGDTALSWKVEYRLTADIDAVAADFRKQLADKGYHIYSDKTSTSTDQGLTTTLHQVGANWATAQGGPAPNPPDRMYQVDVIVSKRSDGIALVQVLASYPSS